MITCDVVEQGVELDDFVSGPRELLLKLVDEHYPLPPEPKTLQGHKSTALTT